MILKVLRNAMGLPIVFFDWLTRPTPIRRSTEDQQTAQAALNGHALYQLYACPFCVKTRRAVHTLGVDLEARNINKHPHFRAELEQGGGRVKVPCLRIEREGDVQWMYESKDIISYLESRVA